MPIARHVFERPGSDDDDDEVNTLVPFQLASAVSIRKAQGLEYDSVLVVAPERILADGPRGAAELYVALTRATQRLGVLHHEPLPAALSGLSVSAPVRT